VTDRIDLTGIEVRARHGALPEEKTRNQLFLVDVAIFLDTRPAALSDELSDTLDYGALMRGVHYLVAGESHNLIETVANRVAALVLEHPTVERVIVTVHKPQAPVPLVFGDVSVTVDRTR
jgi:dihydroneopterin aldolase